MITVSPQVPTYPVHLLSFMRTPPQFAASVHSSSRHARPTYLQAAKIKPERPGTSLQRPGAPPVEDYRHKCAKLQENSLLTIAPPLMGSSRDVDACVHFASSIELWYRWQRLRWEVSGTSGLFVGISHYTHILKACATSPDAQPLCVLINNVFKLVC